MSNAKERLLAGTILSALAIGLAHAAPLDGVLVVAQAPQGDHEKGKKPQDHEKEKKPERQGQPPPPQQRQGQPPPAATTASGAAATSASSVRCSHLRHSSVRCSRHHLRHSSVRCSRRDLRQRSVWCSLHRLRHSSARCSRRRHSGAKCNRRHPRHSSVRCSRRPYSSKSSRRARLPARHTTARSTRRRPSRRATASADFATAATWDSPPLPHPRCNHRLRRLGPLRRRRSARSCRLRHRITRAGSMTCAAPDARCARATVS